MTDRTLPLRQPPYLTDRYWSVLTARAANTSWRAIAKDLGVSAARVRHIEAEAWRKIDQRRRNGLPDESLATRRLPERKPHYLSDEQWRILALRSVLADSTQVAAANSLGIPVSRMLRLESRAWAAINHRRDRGLPDDYSFAVSREWRQAIDDLFADIDHPWANTARNTLLRVGFRDPQDIARASDEDLLAIRNFGPRCLALVRSIVPYSGEGRS